MQTWIFDLEDGTQVIREVEKFSDLPIRIWKGDHWVDVLYRRRLDDKDLPELLDALGFAYEATFGKATEHRDDMPHNWRIKLGRAEEYESFDFYGGSAVHNVNHADLVHSLILDKDISEDPEAFGIPLSPETIEKARENWNKFDNLIHNQIELELIRAAVNEY